MENLKALLGSDIAPRQLFMEKDKAIRGSRKAGAKASTLMKQLGAPQSYFKWYCKVINTLPQATVEKCAIAAIELATCPHAYFIKLATQEMEWRTWQAAPPDLRTAQ